MQPQRSNERIPDVVRTKACGSPLRPKGLGCSQVAGSRLRGVNRLLIETLVQLDSPTLGESCQYLLDPKWGRWGMAKADEIKNSAANEAADGSVLDSPAWRVRHLCFEEPAFRSDA